MYLLVILFPFFGFLSSSFFGRFLGRFGSCLLSSSFMFFTFFFSLLFLFEVLASSSPVSIPLFKWVDSSGLLEFFSFRFDSLSVIMLVLVSSISALVHLYSINYMNEDPHLQRFMSYLSLFSFFMILLISGSNLLQIFIGWEGVGIASYLLINFWFTRLSANRASIQALIMNRVGDWGYLIGLFTLVYSFDSLNISTIFGLASFNNQYFTDLICFFLLIGVLGKSAQFSLHLWLPNAMEAPTPVSALIHSATMVTAGVFLLLRFSLFFEFSPSILICIILIGGLTSILGGSIGLVFNDIKKVIAFSTCSQLGYMVYACGISAYTTSLYHLINHGFFKALLFLSSGSLIHALNDEQDMRLMGGLKQLLPVTYIMFLIGSLSILGLPFLSGFYSKEGILESGFGSPNLFAGISYWLCSIAALFTALYSIRIISSTFISPYNGQKYMIYKLNTIVNQKPLLCTNILVLFILGFLSIIFGFLAQDLFNNSSIIFSSSLFSFPLHSFSFFLGGAFFPLFFSIFGLFLGLFIYIIGAPIVLRIKLTKIGIIIYTLLIKRYYFDHLYSNLIIKNILSIGYITSKELDNGITEILGPTGISIGLNKIGKSLLLEDKPITLYGQYLLLTLFLLAFFLLF